MRCRQARGGEEAAPPLSSREGGSRAFAAVVPSAPASCAINPPFSRACAYADQSGVGVYRCTLDFMRGFLRTCGRTHGRACGCDSPESSDPLGEGGGRATRVEQPRHWGRYLRQLHTHWLQSQEEERFLCLRLERWNNFAVNLHF